MAAKTKTTWTGANVNEFIDSFVDKDEKKQDSFRLIELMRDWSGFEPKMWGPTIIGFGRYHYKYASGQEGDAPLLGFSPRKTEFSLYIIDPYHDNKALLDKLGKYRMGKSCIYFKKLADLNLAILEKLSKESIKYVNKKYPTESSNA